MNLLSNQPFTLAAANLTGHASNVTGAEWAITTAGAADDLAHQVTIRNDSVTDHSAKTMLLTGTDANNVAISETLNAPGTSATVTSVKAYQTLLSAVPSETIGADTFDIGWAATGHSPWVYTNKPNFAIAVYVGGTLNYDIQHTYDEESGTEIAFNSAAGKTADFEVVFTHAVRAVRVDVNSHTSGTMTVIVVE